MNVGKSFIVCIAEVLQQLNVNKEGEISHEKLQNMYKKRFAFVKKLTASRQIIKNTPALHSVFLYG